VEGGRVIVLLGVLVVVLGFALRRDPLLVVAVSGVATALLGHLSPVHMLAAFGNGFASSRSVTIYVITLPIIGLLERYGLHDQARRLIGRLRGLTTGRFLVAYLALRQVTSAIGLTNIAGPAQSVRPMVVPMAEAAAERRYGALPDRVRERIRSFSASADTIGLIFAEDCFLAVGSILLITSFANASYGTHLEPLQLALWAIPSAVCAFVFHGGRLLLLDRQLDRELAARSTSAAPGPASEEASK
jgi:uncharacterized membrane protein